MITLVGLIAIGSGTWFGEPKTVTVFAAASLRDAFTAIGRDYERLHPDTQVTFSFAGSQTLTSQINQGAPADVFASASMKNLLESKPLPSSVQTFAFNQLVLIERKGWFGIKRIQDLASVPKLVLADKTVPAGNYAEQFLLKAAKEFGDGWRTTVESHVVSREVDVRSVLAKVKLGEADAGVVYATDALSALGGVTTIEVPAKLNVVAQYVVGLLATSPNPSGGTEFIKFLSTPTSRAELKAQGFILPTRSSS